MRATTGGTRTIHGVCQGVPKGKKILHVDAEMDGAIGQRAERKRFPMRQSPSIPRSSPRSIPLITVFTTSITISSLNGFRRNAAYRPFATSAMVLSGKRTHHHSRRGSICRILPHGLEHGGSVHYRHHEVEQHEIWRAARRRQVIWDMSKFEEVYRDRWARFPPRGLDASEGATPRHSERGWRSLEGKKGKGSRRTFEPFRGIGC
jgi:hypothetical protein